MFKITLVLVALALVSVSCRPAEREIRRSDQSLTNLELEEAKGAKYHFASDVQDGISDLTQQREEVRDGLAVKGFYSYSDGHFRTKVSYEADENGYRIVGMEQEPLEGPVVDPEGTAEVRTLAHGSETAYSVTGDDNIRHRQTHFEREEKSKN